MVGGAGDGIGHVLEAQLAEARQELLVVLVAKDAQHPFRRIPGAAPRDQGEDQAGEIGVVQPGSGLQGSGVVSRV